MHQVQCHIPLTGDGEEAASVSHSLLPHQWAAVDTTSALSTFPKVSPCLLRKIVWAEAE